METHNDLMVICLPQYPTEADREVAEEIKDAARRAGFSLTHLVVVMAQAFFSSEPHTVLQEICRGQVLRHAWVVLTSRPTPWGIADRQTRLVALDDLQVKVAQWLGGSGRPYGVWSGVTSEAGLERNLGEVKRIWQGTRQEGYLVELSSALSVGTDWAEYAPEACGGGNG